VSDIGATRSHGDARPHRPALSRSRSPIVWPVLLLLSGVLLSFPLPAFGGHASTGELAFYPCDRCHPVTLGADGKPTKQLPVGLKRHEITLEVHDTLGTSDKACLACHDDPTRDPGKLVLPDGSLVAITGDVSRVCQRCHGDKYRAWQQGVHGKREPKCTAAGCHDPHTPSWIYVPALPPFQGTGFEVHAVNARVAFKPLAGPPLAPPVNTPLWLVIVASIGGVAILSILGYLTLGRRAS